MINEENKLDPEFKVKWLAALRSGEYKQGTGKMFDPRTNSYCCLGLAGHVCGIPDEKILGGYFLEENAPKEYPPQLIVQQYSKIPFQTGLGEILYGMNDSGKTFSEIADYIETNL